VRPAAQEPTNLIAFLGGHRMYVTVAGQKGMNDFTADMHFTEELGSRKRGTSLFGGTRWTDVTTEPASGPELYLE
jgi:hypothetical protein